MSDRPRPWRTVYYESPDDDDAASGYIIDKFEGATKDEAESALQAIRAMEAMEKLEATDLITWCVNDTCYGAEAITLQKHAYGPTRTAAILALAAQIEGKQA